MRKAELIALLEEESRPVAPPRNKGKKRGIFKVRIIPHPQNMDVFERQEMQRQRPLVKSKLNKWYDWLVHHIEKTVESKVSDAFNTFQNRIERLCKKVTGKETWKDIVELKQSRKRIKKKLKRSSRMALI